MSSSRKIWLIVIVLLAAALAGMAAVSWTSTTTQHNEVPITQVKRGEFNPKIFAAGELKASHLAVISAPQIGGGTLQINRLLGTGTRVRKGDLIVEFDPTEQQFKFEQSQSELKQAEQEIIKAKADVAVQAATDKVALLKARFDVRSAQLEIEKNELLSSIDVKKNQLALEQAQRALDQLEQDITSHTSSGAASVGLAEEKRHKAQLSMEQAKQNIEKMKLLAPMDGVVAIERNMDSNGGMFWDGMSVPDYREGDQAYPGRSIAQVIDPNDMEVSAKLNERDRNNVKVGQRAQITLDALPGRTFEGVVKMIGGMASRNIFDDEQGGRFEITVGLPGSDPKLLVGFTVQVVVIGDVKKDVLYVPRQAVFMSNGKRIVYVKKGNDFEPREIKVITETESRAVLEDLNAGTEIALVNPMLPKPSTGSSGGQSSIGAGMH